MYREVGKLASRQGIDPRDFTLLAFGGAGPMLGCFLARELGMRRVLIPTAPGVLSALGGLVADVKNDFISTAYYPLSAAELPRLKADFDHLARRAAAWITDEQKFAGPYVLQPAADMRYQGNRSKSRCRCNWTGSRRAIGSGSRRPSMPSTSASTATAPPPAPVSLVSLRMVVVGTSPQPQVSGTAAGSPARRRPSSRSRCTLTALGAPCRSIGVPTWEHGHRLGSPCVVAQEDYDDLRSGGLSPARSTRTAIFSDRSRQ
jgi:N-methylhydantoinase A